MEFLTLKNPGNKELKWKIEVDSMTGENLAVQQQISSSKNLIGNQNTALNKKPPSIPLNLSPDPNRFCCF